MEFKTLILQYNKIKYSVYYDVEDENLISQFNWSIDGNSVLGRTKGSKPWKKVKMHRLVMGISDPTVIIDHINHNGLDNRKVNLRLCSIKENNQNKLKQQRNSTGYKGVIKEDWAYAVNIGVNYKLIRVGRFYTLEEAARAYDSAAVYFFGEFASLNFPDEVPIPFLELKELLKHRPRQKKKS